MFVAGKDKIEHIVNEAIYGKAAKVNAAVVEASGGKVPCFAISGKRIPFKWVSIGSSCVIGRGEAKRWLSSVGVDIDQIEAAA